MDKRFLRLFNLTEKEAIALLDTPQEQVEENDSRYIAASHLVNFPTEESIHALTRAIQNTDPSLENRIVRRKSVETLGRLQAKQALSVICSCLGEEDAYTVENAVWAIGEIGTQDPDILAAITELLLKPGQSYRVIIHTLAKLDYKLAQDTIAPFVDAEDQTIASAAIAAVCRLSGDYSSMEKVVEFLQHSNVTVRRGCIQDLIDCNYYAAIPKIACCPVSLVFRLRGIRLMAEPGLSSGKLTFAAIQPSLEQVLRDHPEDLDLVHEYDQNPTLDFVISELYHTDFGRCYLATKTILDNYAEQAPEALLSTYAAEAYNDYGAHYHVIKLLGWLKYAHAYDLLMEALQNPAPQFQKSRAAAALALGELGEQRAIPALKASLETQIWDLKYTALMALEKLGDFSGHTIASGDQDMLIRLKASQSLKL